MQHIIEYIETHEPILRFDIEISGHYLIGLEVDQGNARVLGAVNGGGYSVTDEVKIITRKTERVMIITYEKIVNSYMNLPPEMMPSGIIINPSDEQSLIRDIVPEAFMKEVKSVNKVGAFDVYKSEQVTPGTFKFVL